MTDRTKTTLTTPDLVVLCLLAEQPMHGYQLVAELENREVRDWAGISRPQVYYSLKKLEAGGLIAQAEDQDPAAGPERRIFQPTKAAKAAVAQALDQEPWATQRPPNPFITWLVLSAYARPQSVTKIVHSRRQFLEAQVEKEKAALEAIRADPGPGQAVAEAVVQLSLSQFELELQWLLALPFVEH